MAGLGLYFAGWKKWGGRILVTAMILFAGLGILPIGTHILNGLETRYPRVTIDSLPDNIAGIIVLGGMISTSTSESYDYTNLNSNATRLYDFIRLHKTFPESKAIYSGGNGKLWALQTLPETHLRKSLPALGVNPADIIFESKSRNTYENAVFSKKIADPKPGENWIVVTSAFHMPRTIAIFCSQGWSVIPFPAGHITLKNPSYYPATSYMIDEHFKLHVAVREWIGILAYRIFGKTSMVLPPTSQKKENSDAAPVQCNT